MVSYVGLDRPGQSLHTLSKRLSDVGTAISKLSDEMDSLKMRLAHEGLKGKERHNLICQVSRRRQKKLQLSKEYKKLASDLESRKAQQSSPSDNVVPASPRTLSGSPRDLTPASPASSASTGLSWSEPVPLEQYGTMDSPLALHLRSLSPLSLATTGPVHYPRSESSESTASLLDDLDFASHPAAESPLPDSADALMQAVVMSADVMDQLAAPEAATPPTMFYTPPDLDLTPPDSPAGALDPLFSELHD